jgi:hypothetical protein
VVPPVVPGQHVPLTNPPVALGEGGGVDPVLAEGVGVGVLQDEEGLRPDHALHHLTHMGESAPRPRGLA